MKLPYKDCYQILFIHCIPVGREERFEFQILNHYHFWHLKDNIQH